MDLRCQFSKVNNVAITGATGFIGRRLKGVFLVDDFIPVAIEDVPCQAIFIHLAANISNSRDALLDNIDIDSYLLEIANRNQCSVIYASTNNVYPLKMMCNVNDELIFHDYYAASKITGERLFLNFIKKNVLILRLPDVFGAGQKHGNLFKAIEMAIKEKNSLNLYGKGLKTRTYIHVDELSKLIHFYLNSYLLKTNFKNNIVNVGYADSVSVKDIIEIAAHLSNLPVHSIMTGSDISSKDVRTLKVSFPEGYTPLWGSFKEAFHVYIKGLN